MEMAKAVIYKKGYEKLQGKFQRRKKYTPIKVTLDRRPHGFGGLSYLLIEPKPFEQCWLDVRRRCKQRDNFSQNNSSARKVK